jgi:hypothetical protein
MGRTSIERLPDGLSADEREWVLARAARAGGLNAAFVALVRLNILTDAAAACMARMRAVSARLEARDCGRARIEREVWRAAARTTVASLIRRLVCAATWTRPGAIDRRRPHDDPAVPLPHALTRRLIGEGRAHFEAENRRASAERRCH